MPLGPLGFSAFRVSEAVRLLKAATYAAAVDPETGRMLIVSGRSLVTLSLTSVVCSAGTLNAVARLDVIWFYMSILSTFLVLSVQISQIRLLA